MRAHTYFRLPLTLFLLFVSHVLSSRRRLYEEKTPSQPMSSSPLKQSPRHDARMVSSSQYSRLSTTPLDFPGILVLRFIKYSFQIYRLFWWHIEILTANLVVPIQIVPTVFCFHLYYGPIWKFLNSFPHEVEGNSLNSWFVGSSNQNASKGYDHNKFSGMWSVHVGSHKKLIEVFNVLFSSDHHVFMVQANIWFIGTTGSISVAKTIWGHSYLSVLNTMCWIPGTIQRLHCFEQPVTRMLSIPRYWNETFTLFVRGWGSGTLMPF